MFVLMLAVLGIIPFEEVDRPDHHSETTVQPDGMQGQEMLQPMEKKPVQAGFLEADGRTMDAFPAVIPFRDDFSETLKEVPSFVYNDLQVKIREEKWGELKTVIGDLERIIIIQPEKPVSGKGMFRIVTDN